MHRRGREKKEYGQGKEGRKKRGRKERGGGGERRRWEKMVKRGEKDQEWEGRGRRECKRRKHSV